MTALSNVSTAISASATEGDLKSFLLNQYNYLAGLFGTDGVKATAKSTLGIVDGVTSVNGNTGAITAAQIAAAATAGYGYTPAQANAPVTVELIGSYSLSPPSLGSASMNVYNNFGYGIYYAGKTGGDSAVNLSKDSCIAFDSASGTIIAYNSAATSGTKTIYFNLYRMRNL